MTDELPNFVAVGGTAGPGYLGPKYAPLIVNDFDGPARPAPRSRTQGDVDRQGQPGR